MAAAAVIALLVVVVATAVPSTTGVSEAAPTQRIVTFAGDTDGTLAMAFTPGEPGAVFWGSGLPDPGPGKVYEIWMIEGDRPVSGGCVTPHRRGRRDPGRRRHRHHRHDGGHRRARRLPRGADVERRSCSPTSPRWPEPTVEGPPPTGGRGDARSYRNLNHGLPGALTGLPSVVLDGNEPVEAREGGSMNKRSALMLSAGLVLTLIVGGLAVATGLTGPSVSNAVPRAQRSSTSEPVVRTVRRTVTVHKKADAKPGQVVRVAAPAATSGTSGMSGSSGTSGDDDAYDDDDDGYEDDDSDDEQEDHEDHEDQEDHEDEGDDD